MTHEEQERIKQGFAEMADAMKLFAEALRELAEVIGNIIMPLIRQIVVSIRRYGFYCWLYKRLRSLEVAWWVAWRLPDSWVLKLPIRWVAWPM